jgi:hypothetical protein
VGHKGPADLLRVGEDAGLDGFVFGGGGISDAAICSGRQR